MVSSTMKLWTLAAPYLYLSCASAQSWNHGDNGSNHGPPWSSGNGGNASESLYGYLVSDSTNRVLIAHAVTASAVWVILMPLGGILLRLNIKSPWVLRVHATLQIMSYLLFIAAAGMGIYLVQNITPFDGDIFLWRSSHPQLGLAILGLATFQPALGALHHRLFKNRVENKKAGKSGPASGRTIPGYMHIWLGRILIVLGIVNGGIGINIAGQTPFQSPKSTRTVAIVYGIVAAIMFLAYILIVVPFERNKAQLDREFQTSEAKIIHMPDIPPAYTESQETLQKPGEGATRYV